MVQIFWECDATPNMVASFHGHVQGWTEVTNLSNPMEEIQQAAEDECARRGMCPPLENTVKVIRLHNYKANFETVFPTAEGENIWYGKPMQYRYRDDDERLQTESLHQYHQARGRSWFRKVYDWLS